MAMNEQVDKTSAPVPDAELVELVLQGKKRYFEDIIRRYNQRLYRMGMAILSNDSDVEDAMQSAYVSAFMHLHTFARRSSFATWLTRIMLNQCIGQKRKNRLTQDKLKERLSVAQTKTPANQLLDKELHSVLETAIAKLPEKYRTVFILREVEALSVRETSQTLCIEEVNVKVRLNRAKTMLRKSLDDYMKDKVYHFHLLRCDMIVNNVMKKLGLLSLSD